MRERILEEIRRLAEANDGRAPGVRLFERETGLSEGKWRGVYWARWGDAVRDAGLTPNVRQEKLEERFFFEKLANACRHFGRFPTAMELRMFKKHDVDLPNVKSFTRHFGSLTDAPSRLASWAKDNAPDLIPLLAVAPISAATPHKSSTKVEGYVYLIKSGSHYKIGKSDEVERRLKEIRVALPDVADMVHVIRTDDPSGIEAYWHRRFAASRANGEWFKLTPSDVAAFKRRKYQ